MINLALIGKNIQHSRSPEIYGRLIKDKLNYDLLDYSESSSIPKAIELLSRYDGISITSPYKKHFLDEVELTESAQELKAINCLKKQNGKIVGENTDYLAIIDILKKWKEEYKDINVIILGDGVMAKVTEVALKKLGIDFKSFSRRSIDQFGQINLKKQFASHFFNSQQSVVINTCAREYVFQGEIPADAIFWDFNYDFRPHSSSLPQKVKQYCDGFEMLELQARHALVFWSVTRSDSNN